MGGELLGGRGTGGRLWDSSSGSVHAAVLLIGREGNPRAEASSRPLLPARVAVRDVEVVQQR